MFFFGGVSIGFFGPGCQGSYKIVLALIREAGCGVGEALYRFLKETVRKFNLPLRFPKGNLRSAREDDSWSEDDSSRVSVCYFSPRL